MIKYSISNISIYTDNLKDESDINKRKIEHDKLSLSLMNDYISDGNPEKVVSLFESLILDKSRVKALEICQYHEKRNLEFLLKTTNPSYKIICYF